MKGRNAEWLVVLGFLFMGVTNGLALYLWTAHTVPRPAIVSWLLVTASITSFCYVGAMVASRPRR